MLDLGFITSLHNSLIPPFSWGMRGRNGHPTVATGGLLDAVTRDVGKVASILLGIIVWQSSARVLSLISAAEG